MKYTYSILELNWILAVIQSVLLPALPSGLQRVEVEGHTF